jgi:hypothetical protein
MCVHLNNVYQTNTILKNLLVKLQPLISEDTFTLIQESVVPPVTSHLTNVFDQMLTTITERVCSTLFFQQM